MDQSFEAAVWRGNESLTVERFTMGPLRSSEVLIRVSATNVNFSDYISTHSAVLGLEGPPEILGHGSVGVVQSVGSDVKGLYPGDRVVATSTPQCGECWFCNSGRAFHCATMVVNGPSYATDSGGQEVVASGYVGGFADLATVPWTQLTKVDTDLSDEVLALLAVSFGSGIGAALRTAPIVPGAAVAAVGLGVSGLAYVQGAVLAGASIIIGIDPVEMRRNKALECGATHVIDPTVGDALEAVRAIGGDRGGMSGAGVDFAFESAATPEGIVQAWEMLRVTGELVVSSVPVDLASSVSFPVIPFTCFGKKIHSNQYGSLNIRRDLSWAINLIELGLLKPEILIDKAFSLREINEAISAVGSHLVLGATVLFQDRVGPELYPIA